MQKTTQVRVEASFDVRIDRPWHVQFVLRTICGRWRKVESEWCFAGETHKTLLNLRLGHR